MDRRVITAPPPPIGKAVVIGSLGWSLVNFRLDLMRRLQSEGYDVVAVAGDLDQNTAAKLAQHDIETRVVPIDRTGTHPIRDLRCLWALYRLLRQEAPDLVIAYTMKPILYGLLAAQLARVPRRFALFTGLGFGFMQARPTGRRALVRRVAIWLHRVCLRRITGAFCYNRADRRDIRRHRMIPARTPLWDIPGSGVDTARFTPTPLPQGPVRFLFVGRMLASKGLEDLARAARLLKAEGHEFTLDLLGPTDSNPDAIPMQNLGKWQARGLVNWLGECRDVRPHLANCTVFVLPTRLREGIPRSILEAMASGRAVITSDAPGCGENVPEECGVVVPRGDPRALAAAMLRFIKTRDLAARMGRIGRQRACEFHDVHRVNAQLIKHMGLDATHDGATASAGASSFEGVRS